MCTKRKIARNEWTNTDKYREVRCTESPTVNLGIVYRVHGRQSFGIQIHCTMRCGHISKSKAQTDYTLQGTQQTLHDFDAELLNWTVCVCASTTAVAYTLTRSRALTGLTDVSVSLSSECETRCRQVILQLFSFCWWADGRYTRPTSVLMHKSILTLTSVYWKAIDSNYLVEIQLPCANFFLFSIHCSTARRADCWYTMCAHPRPFVRIHSAMHASSWPTNKCIYRYKAIRVAHNVARIVWINKRRGIHGERRKVEGTKNLFPDLFSASSVY